MRKSWAIAMCLALVCLFVVGGCGCPKCGAGSIAIRTEDSCDCCKSPGTSCKYASECCSLSCVHGTCACAPGIDDGGRGYTCGGGGAAICCNGCDDMGLFCR
jgi:hypothetical protein